MAYGPAQTDERAEREDAYNNGDLDVIKELLAPDWKSNNFPSAVLEQTLDNLEVLQGMLLEAFPDLHVTTHELIAEGDVVVQSWTARATHKGDLVGLAPTGNPIEVGGAASSRSRTGRSCGTRPSMT